MHNTNSALSILTGTLLYFAFFGTAHALFVTDSGGVSASTTLTFDEIIVPNDPDLVYDDNFGLLTDQYESTFGVTIASGLYQGNLDGPAWGAGANISGYALSNITATLDPLINPIEITFSSVQTNAGFNLVGFNIDPTGPNTTFSAFLNDTLVESAVALVNNEAPNFYGFSGLAFNKLVIEVGSMGTGGFLPVAALDNLTFDAMPVDEPPGFALIIIGLMGIVFIRELGKQNKI
jgi:hypothetical protein